MADEIENQEEDTPVSVAAAMLGMSTDALRKRVKRGTAPGYRRSGRVFVDNQWLADMRGRPRPRQPGENDTVAGAVIELQKTELSRLLRDNSVLNERLDGLLKGHEREQVLRQQMQNMLERLSERPSLPPPQAPSPDMARLEHRLSEAESQFGALKVAVASLVDYLAREKRL